MPDFWDGVIGHKPVVKLLKLWVEHPAFSYLLYGQPHLGKTFLAEKFVRALVDDSSERDLNLHPDVVLFLPEEGKKDIAVEQVRKNRWRLYERPQFAKRVVAFLPQLDRLNDSGFNALLKVMEEPPANAVFVAVAENLSRVPATILSRTVCVPLGLVPQKEIQLGLADRGLSLDQAQARALASRGRPGLAMLENDPLAVFTQFAGQYVAGPSTGHRLAAAERLRQACESDADANAAWSTALEACMTALRSIFQTSTQQSLILAQGVADATSAIGGSVSPRFMLDAAALQAARGKLSLPNLYPRYFPLSLTL